MADLSTLLKQLHADGTIHKLANNPASQFGTRERAYLGATILPERNVEENQYTEEDVQYRTVIANDGTRYSPVVLKGSAMVGSFDVKLAEQDAGSQLTSHDYDTIVKMLGKMSMDAASVVIRFLDTTIVAALAEKSELQRWQAIVSAKVELRGANGYKEDISYSNPAGHRYAVAKAWSDATSDPIVDLQEMAQKFSDKGMQASRYIMRRSTFNLLLKNPNVKNRFVGLNGVAPVAVSLADVNSLLAANGLPSVEFYDLQFRHQTGTAHFLSQNAVVCLAATGRDASLDMGDKLEFLQNVIGYTGVGRAAGQASSGKVIVTRHITDSKPPRLEAEGWQTTLPVILEPEAIVVAKGMNP